MYKDYVKDQVYILCQRYNLPLEDARELSKQYVDEYNRGIFKRPMDVFEVAEKNIKKISKQRGLM